MKHMPPHKTAGRRYTGLLSRFMWVFGTMCVLVLLTSTLFGMKSFQDTLVSSVEELEADYLKVQASNVDLLLHRYGSKVYEMAVDQTLLTSAKALGKEGDTAEMIHTLRTTLQNHIGMDGSYVAATFTPDGKKFYTVSRLHDSSKWQSWFSPVPAPKNDEALAELCRMAEEKGNLVVGTYPNSRERISVRLFQLACPVYDLLTRKHYGTVVLTVNSAYLAEIVNANTDQRETSVGVLTAQDGTVICHTQPEWIGRHISETDKFGSDKYLLGEETTYLGFTVYRVVNRALLLSRAWRNYSWQTAIIILVTAAGFFLVTLLMHRMTRSTRILLQGIERLGGGDTDVRVKVTDHHEIGAIAQAFNQLVGQLQQARERETVHARQSMEALTRQHRAEMQSLERQINAHFLYNTLNTISYTAIESGSEETSQQIRYLASILRYSFENSSGVVTATQVMAWLDDYLTLQRLRYGCSFDYTGHVEPAVKDWPLRKLLIQPFVENAVLHGFEGMSHGCRLSISFRSAGRDKMRVTITDNGKGFPAWQVEELNAFFRGEREGLSFAKGVGMDNARQRLLLFYGREAKVFFRSHAGVQTVVTLLLPKYKDQPEITQADRLAL